MINYRNFNMAEVYEIDEQTMAEAAMSAAEAREEAVRARFGDRFEWAMNMIERRRRARRARRAARAARRAG